MILPILLGLILGATAFPEEDFRDGFEMMGYSSNLDEPRYRLKDSVQPRNVYLHLDVYLEEARVNGLVEHEVEVLEQNLTQIVLHQKVVSIQTVTIVDAAGRPVNLQFPDPFTTDNYFEILMINLADPISVGNYTITISYLGRIHLNQFERGFYRGYYYVDNQIHYYATTQFQPYFGRTAFPCFDEPQFKSRYIISITRDSSLSPSYSNMAIDETTVLTPGRVRETFLPTPVVSVYLIAFTVSGFVETTHTGTATKPFGIISRPGVLDQHYYAAEMGLKITNALDDYLGIDYYDMGQGQPMKNDHLAIPDFPAGAMENWGMVNYREAYLLFDPNNTNIDNQLYISTIIAHEMAHKWFGNLVTCFWWSNLWLNESFASYFEYFAAFWADRSLELDELFIARHVHSALNYDAGSGATAMNWTGVVDNPSISSHFSTASYAKGAAVLRTIENFIGERPFRVGLRYYLRDNAYGLGTPEDMYDALRRATLEDMDYLRDYSRVDVGEVMDSWIQNPGSPVVNVDVDMNTGRVTLRQERFLLSGNNDTSGNLWHIPITWTHSGSLNFQNTRPSLIFSTQQTEINNIPGHYWVMLNIAQSGLYRVNYDDHNWEMIASYLRNTNTRTNVHKLNRAQIVNDVLHFLRAGKISMERAFDVLSFLRIETDYYVWNGAIGQMELIRRRMEHLPLAHAEFSNYMLELIETAVNNLGFDERPNDSTSTKLNRMQIMNLACNLGHPRCIADSLAKWNSFKTNPSNLVPVNARRYVYCTGLRQGDASDYQFLYNIYETAENTADMVVILRTLACTTNAASLQDYLARTLTNDKIRVHDRTNAFAYALQGNRENMNAVLEFLFNNLANIREAYGGQARLNVNINNLAGFLTNFSDIQRFQTWVYANQVALGGSFSAAVSAVNTALSNYNWGNNNAAEIYTILLARGSAASIAAPLALIVAALVSHLLR